MVLAAERHGEFVADLAAERPGLGKFQVMGVAGTALADETGLRADKDEMDLVASTALFADRRNYPSGRGTVAVRWSLDERGSIIWESGAGNGAAPSGRAPRASSAAW